MSSPSPPPSTLHPSPPSSQPLTPSQPSSSISADSRARAPTDTTSTTAHAPAPAHTASPHPPAQAPAPAPAPEPTKRAREPGSPPSTPAPAPPAPAPAQPRLARLTAAIPALEQERAALATRLLQHPGAASAAGTGNAPDRSITDNNSTSAAATANKPPDPADPADVPAALALARAINARHIARLHAYNGARDVGMGMLALVADARGVPVKEVRDEMGLDETD